MTRKTIRQYRLDAGLTQQQVADALKVDKAILTSVQKMEAALTAQAAGKTKKPDFTGFSFG